ncbi:MAG: response regulator [Candidatus Omnitrophica bacterium]|nr:response regulator [Candidatus Omnitrophota bacterium]
MQIEELKLKPGEELSFDKKLVFIVDDDKSVRRALKFLLETYGFAVETYSCAEKFFSTVPNSALGCLIMDIHMPGLNGWQALQILIKTRANRPVIIITADRNSDFKEQALKAGTAGFLQKPFNDNELVDLINLTFEGRIR